MKVSQEEIEAALSAFHKKQTDLDYSLRRAIKAALTVRRARKKAKRERQRKEKDKQVVESVKEQNLHLQQKADLYLRSLANSHTPSKAPEWDGNASAFDSAMKPKA